MEGTHMTDLNTSRAAGWYPAEGDPPGTQRYWDGAAWQGGPQVAPEGVLGIAAVGGAPATAAVTTEASTDSGYKGFFPTLFDLSLNSFLAPKVIRVLYIVALVLICVLTVVLAIATVVTGDGVAAIVGGLIVVPLAGLLYLLLLRIQAEFVIVSFRTYEQLRSVQADLDNRSS